MPFEPGNSGNPKGQIRAKEFAQNLRIAVAEAHAKGGTKLRALADKLVEEGLSGNVHALKEIADRLDGRVPQAITVDQEERIKFIAVVPQKASTTEEWLRLVEGVNPNASRDVIEGYAREIEALPNPEKGAK
jgi:hypothetical protein